MHSTVHPPAPALFSTTRVISFLACLLVALSSGTNYVFSAYAPQLGSRLQLTHTRLNIIGLSGNIGVYGSAPLWGRIVDTRGPRALLAMAFVALLSGYLGIRHVFDAGLATGESTLGVVGFCALVLLSFITGIGGNGGLASAMNATAKSFPERARATTNGIVISGFGLSAFLFSTIAHIAFPGNTSDFLFVLAVGTSLPMILGFFLVRPIPLPHSELIHGFEHGSPEDSFEDTVGPNGRTDSPSAFHRNASHAPLLDDGADYEDAVETLSIDEESPLSPARHHQQTTISSDYVVPVVADSVALSPTRSEQRHRSRSTFSISRRSVRSALAGGLKIDSALNVHGKILFMSSDFWFLFVITSLLSGVGLMYINNVGSISQALFAKGNSDYDETKASQWQATQVSAISVMNCTGRISIGILADFLRNFLHLPRSFCITLIAVIFIVSQVTCFYIEDVKDLWKASVLLGLAYGGMFGLFPTITIEWFGMPHFSENWGFVSLAPMIGSNIFSLAFGRNLDAHSSDSNSSNSTLTAVSLSPSITPLQQRAGLPSTQRCFDGRACYVDTLKLTIAACCLALGLSIYTGWRDRQRQLRIALKGVEVAPEVVWEAED